MVFHLGHIYSEIFDARIQFCLGLNDLLSYLFSSSPGSYFHVNVANVCKNIFFLKKDGNTFKGTVHFW